VHHLTRGLSGAVLSGFTTGVACVIFLSQLPKLLGLTVERQRYSHQTIVEICLHIPTLNVLALLVGVGAAVALQVTKKWRQQYSPPLSSATTTTSTSTNPSTRWSWSTVLSCLHVASRYSLLVTGVLTTLLSWVVHNYTELSMPIVGSVPRGLPSPQLPSLSPSLHLQLLPGAIMVALITFAGNWAVAKKFAEKNNYAISGRSEMMAYGLCNLVGSMFHSYVVAGGFSRSAVNAEGGALTPLAGFISGVCMLMALQFFTSLFFYLPLATLGAIIVVSVVSMMDFKRIFVAYQKGFYQDCVVMLGTLLCTFFAGVTVGLLCGVALSVGGLLLSISTPEFSSQVPTDSGSCASNTSEQHVDIATCNSFRLVSMSSLLYSG
jgi:SulP family sulfate permease